MEASSKFAWMVKSQQEQLVHFNIEKLIPNPQNFYSIGNIEELARSIEITKNITPLTIVPIAGTDKFKILEGHRRFTACKKLIDEGRREIKTIPCIIRRQLSEREETIQLINSNRQQRERTISEKLRELEMLEPYAREDYEKISDKAKGSFRAFFANWLGDKDMSESTLQRLLAIQKLIEPLLELVEKSELSETAAAILGSKPQFKQYIFYTAFQKGTTSLLLSDIKRFFSDQGDEKKEPEKETGRDVESDKDDSSEASDQIPETSDQIPEASGNSPETAEQIPETSEQIPEMAHDQADTPDDRCVTEENKYINTDKRHFEADTAAEQPGKGTDTRNGKSDKQNNQTDRQNNYIDKDEAGGGKEIASAYEIAETTEQSYDDTDSEKAAPVCETEIAAGAKNQRTEEIKWLLNAISNQISLTLTEKIEMERKYTNDAKIVFYENIERRLAKIISQLEEEMKG